MAALRLSINAPQRPAPRLTRAGGAENRRKAEPQRDRSEREASKIEEHRAIADFLGNPAADRRTERRAKTLHRHDRAPSDIDPSGTVENPCHKAGNGDALQSGADPIENLHRVDAPFVDGVSGDDAADRQRDK
jgi:hypothetical protein